MKKNAEYKVVSGVNGFGELEEKVSQMLNQGWKPVGGIGFNSGYPYQAMARIVTETPPPKKTKPSGAQDAMRAIDQLT